MIKLKKKSKLSRDLLYIQEYVFNVENWNERKKIKYIKLR
jgi:hypothetical protein